MTQVKECKSTYENSLKCNSSKGVLSIQKLLNLESSLSQDSRKVDIFKKSLEEAKNKLELNKIVLTEKMSTLIKTQWDLTSCSINSRTSKLESKVFGELKLKKSDMPGNSPTPAFCSNYKRLRTEPSALIENNSHILSD